MIGCCMDIYSNVGYQGCVTQIGVMMIIVTFSLSVFLRTLPIRLKGGKEFGMSWDQICCSASTALKFGFAFRLMYDVS